MSHEQRAVDLVKADDGSWEIPTREEHRRSIRKMWIVCNLIAFGVFLSAGGTVAALALKGYQWALIVAVSTSIFQVIVMSYALAFFVPSFLTSLSKLSLGIEMSRRSLEMGQKSVDTLEKVDKAIESRLERVDGLVGKLERMLEQAEKGEHPLLKRLEETFRLEMKGLREAVREKKREAEEELDEALAEGEREADEILVHCGICGIATSKRDSGLCPVCESVHPPPVPVVEDGVQCDKCGVRHDDGRCPLTGAPPVA